MTSIGRLRHRVTLQQKQQVRDDAGGFTTTWATVTTMWAKLSPAGSREQARGDTLYGNSTHTLTYRTSAAPTIDSTMRISYGGAFYNIEGIPRPDDYKRFSTVGVVKGQPS